jgi:hypothetical protein
MKGGIWASLYLLETSYIGQMERKVHICKRRRRVSIDLGSSHPLSFPDVRIFLSTEHLLILKAVECVL